jgi:hypothetical protein
LNSNADQALTHREILLLAGIVLLLAALRIPALTGPANINHDSAEYIDIARNIAAGEGPTLKIRAYFFGDGLALPYPASSLRSTLFSYLMAGVYYLIPSNRVFHWFNLGMFFVNMLLLAAILRPLIPFRILAYSLLLIGLSETMFLTSIFPWAEQTAFFWLLVATLLACREIHRRWGTAGAVLEGLAAFFASMNRPEYVLVGILFFIWLCIRDRRPTVCMAFLGGFLLPLAGFYTWNYRTYGQFFFPGEYLFRSRHYAAYLTWDNSNNVTAGRFVLSNWLWIIAQILKNAANYIAKLVGWKNLFLLVVALPPVIRSAFRDQSWNRRIIAFIPMIFFIAYCLVWAGMDRERYFIAIIPFLLPLCLTEINRWRLISHRKWIRVVLIFIMSVNLPLLLAYVIHSDLTIQRRTGIGERFYARDNPAWSNPDMAALADWISKNTGPDEVICLENPFLANYLTGRPALLLPEHMSAANFPVFLNTYKVRYWINNSIYTKRSPERLAELRQAVRNAGAQEAGHSGSYEIWRIDSDKLTTVLSTLGNKLAQISRTPKLELKSVYH